MQKPAKTISSDVKKPSLKDCFNKSYVLDHSEHYEQFLKELGVKKNVRLRAVQCKPRVTLSQEKDEYFLTTSFPEIKDVTVKFKPGEEIHRCRPGGAATTSVFQLDGNNLREEQQIDDKMVVIERMFTKKQLKITMEVNDVKCQRFYTMFSSDHSIGTETSRRSSLWRKSTSTEPESGHGEEIESILESVLTPEAESEESLCF